MILWKHYLMTYFMKKALTEAEMAFEKGGASWGCCGGR